MSGIVKDKDQKIIWARAAGRCSMQDCRKKLTLDGTAESTSVTLGEMCHIVGEKNAKGSPRGLNALPEEYRNEYSNLILLCAHHHREIDKNAADWPISVLHKIKADHELWVEESLGIQLTPKDIIYSNLVDFVNSALYLNNWHYFINNAVRQILPNIFVEAWESVNERILAIVWPDAIPEFEEAGKALLESYSEYISYFLKFSVGDGEVYREDVYYKRMYNPDYHFMSDRSNLWVRKTFLLLCTYTANVNEFARMVRTHQNPLFFVKQGNFLVQDELGIHGGGEGFLMLPDKAEIYSRLKQIDSEISTFKELYKGRDTEL